MTELEIMQHAKLYLDKMVQGIDPLSNQPVAEDDMIRQVRIVKCLDYVSGVLGKVIDNGGHVGRAPKDFKLPFALDEDTRARFPYADDAVFITEFARRINTLIDPAKMTQLSYNSVTGWLVQNGYLEIVQQEENRTAKMPTEAGHAVGIRSEHRESSHGAYEAVLYTNPAQHFLMEHLDDILTYVREKHEK